MVPLPIVAAASPKVTNPTTPTSATPTPTKAATKARASTNTTTDKPPKPPAAKGVDTKAKTAAKAAKTRSTYNSVMMMSGDILNMIDSKHSQWCWCPVGLLDPLKESRDKVTLAMSAGFVQDYMLFDAKELANKYGADKVAVELANF
eukprot:15459186-Alexandrium_andersonii.AAC.1